MTVQWDPARAVQDRHEAQIARAAPRRSRARRERRPVGAAARTRAHSPRRPLHPDSSPPSSSSSQRRSRRCRTSSSATSRISPFFWQPQYDASARNVSAAAYEAAARGQLRRAQGGRPGDQRHRPRALPARERRIRARPATSPRHRSVFLEGVGAAYRASGRTRPLMDEFAYHPYPRTDTDSLTEGFLWPNAGVTNLGRIKQAVWDAFHGTAQPTFEDGLRLRLDEVGWQVARARDRRVRLLRRRDA